MEETKPSESTVEELARDHGLPVSTVRLYQTRGRTTPLVLAHFLIDASAGLGYLALRGHVWWLPG